jgi:hypothetical protein
MIEENSGKFALKYKKMIVSFVYESVVPNE